MNKVGLNLQKWDKIVGLTLKSGIRFGISCLKWDKIVGLSLKLGLKLG